MSTLGTTIYAIGMGLLAGFVGNVLAGWFNSITAQPSDKAKWFWICVFILFGICLVIGGLLLGTS
jgi:hypothetical protein